MIQTGLIPNAHADLVTDASYDFYGLHLGTCSLDQRIKIWQLDESTGNWVLEDDWKAHDAAISKLSWAHPEFGTIIASSSFDRTVKIWERVSGEPQDGNGTGNSSRWVERAILTEARGTVRAVEFAPHHFGLKLASISTDNHLRIYECLEQPSLTTWQLVEEADVFSLPPSVSLHTNALATPTQTTSTSADGPVGPLVAQALQQSMSGSTSARPGLGHREADGGWCISWCKDRYWGELIAASAGTTGVVKVIQVLPSNRPTTILTLDPSPSPTVDPVLSVPSSIHLAPPGASASPSSLGTNQLDAIPTASTTAVSWAPSCGRSYHLIATGSRDGHVRIWRVKPSEDDDDVDRPGDDGKWSASVVGDFEQHRSAVGRVEWNITGTVLSSAGNDGRIRLWKATSGSVWRPAGSVGVEAREDGEGDGKEIDLNDGGHARDVSMEA
ncbi:WD40-repeat-containing domain protein [Mycena amicta]|nr:WD40-repeat-containing domain protein [Mycena amicta]